MDERRKVRPGRARFSDDASDVVLLNRITQGDRDALRQLYNTYYHPLLRFIYRLTGKLELAQEGINDVMLVVWRTSHAFGGRSAVATWIMGIAYRKALKLLESSRRWSSRIQSMDPTGFERFDAAAEPTVDAELSDLLEHGLRQLSPEHRAVVELTYYYGCSYEEIALIANCPVNTVKTRMFHARAKLRKLLPMLGKDHLPS